MDDKQGSPPHTRGQAYNYFWVTNYVRITPAHAGTSFHGAGRYRVQWDHPRTRGDKFVGMKDAGFAIGSPPHTRGQDTIRTSKKINARITPAHAGTRYTASRRESTRPDHPRTRGDKRGADVRPSAVRGSPPHTRGQESGYVKLGGMGRITPAHAGTSGGLWGHPACKRDHPRTRGDKRAIITENLGSEGSPPHTRGQVFIPHECSAFDRITPAHAGTRRLFSVWLFSIWDHPRTRGDKSCEVCICLTSRGSPPHTRGQG